MKITRLALAALTGALLFPIASRADETAASGPVSGTVQRAAPAADAVQGFDFARTPGALAKNVVPRLYRLSVEPDRALEHFKGRVSIDVETSGADVARVVMHADDSLRIARASIDGKPARVTREGATDRIALAPQAPLAAGAHRIDIDYRGDIGLDARGLYRVSYAGAGGRRRMLATQMEPTGARRLLPLFDEPAFRAAWELTATVPRDFTAVANGDVTATKPLDGGRKQVTFARTPAMSSYLVALFAGEFSVAESSVGATKLRVFTPPGRQTEATEALEATRALLGYYNDYFGQPYPLPKLDQIAVPGGMNGAMENWGAIAYNEGLLLHDPARQSEEHRREVWEIIAHEVAHQWFGNLVTMAWWDELWLNEGFASWMEAHALDALHPDWQPWLGDMGWKQHALDDDALGSFGPIYRPIGQDREALASFDSITYAKGASVIRMLELYLGERRFRDGIRRYMAQHRESNTTRADLWAALATGNDLDARALAEAWVTQPGYPAVKVTRDCSGGAVRVTLAQTASALVAGGAAKAGAGETAGASAATAAGTGAPAAAPARPLPLAVALNPSDGPALQLRQTLSLGADPRVMRLAHCASPLLVNVDDVAFTRVLYDAPSTDALLADAASLRAPDRIAFAYSLWTQARTGAIDTGRLFDALGYLGRHEARPEFWTLVLDIAHTVDRQLPPGADDAQRQALVARLIALTDERFAALGPDARADDSADQIATRAALYETRGLLGEPRVLDHARHRFDDWIAGGQPDPGLRAAILATVARNNTSAATWNALLARAGKAPTQDERRLFWRALGAARDPALAARALDYARDHARTEPNVARLVISVADSGSADAAWQTALRHRDRFRAIVGEEGEGQWLARIAAASDDPARGDELLALARARLGPEGVTHALNAEAQIKLNAQVKARLLAPVVASAR